jgi:hypothetical protein
LVDTSAELSTSTEKFPNTVPSGGTRVRIAGGFPVVPTMIPMPYSFANPVGMSRRKFSVSGIDNTAIWCVPEDGMKQPIVDRLQESAWL